MTNGSGSFFKRLKRNQVLSAIKAARTSVSARPPSPKPAPPIAVAQRVRAATQEREAVGRGGVTGDEWEERHAPAKGPRAPADRVEPAEPNLPLGGKRTNSVTRPLPRNNQMISDSVQAVASALA